MTAIEAQVVAGGIVTGLVLAMVLLVRWTRRRNTNTELWGTVFESLSHYVQPQDLLKEPQQEVRVQNKRATGDDKDKNRGDRDHRA